MATGVRLRKRHQEEGLALCAITGWRNFIDPDEVTGSARTGQTATIKNLTMATPIVSFSRRAGSTPSRQR